MRDTSSSFALRKLRAAQKVISVRVRLRSRASSRQSLGNRAARSMARLGRDQGKWGEGRDLLAPISGWSTRLRYARSEGGEGIARQSGDVSRAVMDVCWASLDFWRHSIASAERAQQPFVTIMLKVEKQHCNGFKSREIASCAASNSVRDYRAHYRVSVFHNAGKHLSTPSRHPAKSRY